MKMKESSRIEFKKSTAELKQALEDICAFANNGEGVLYFGIDDNGKPIGQDISDKTIQKISTSILSSIEPRVYPNIFEQTIQGRHILVVEVKNGPDRPYFYKGKAYKRVGTSNVYLSRYEIEKALYERDNPKYRYERTAIKDYKGSLDRKTINWFLEKAKQERSLPVDDSDKQIDILRKLNLITDGYINLAGLVCFGKEIQRFIPQALVKCAIFEGREKHSDKIIEYKDFRTNIFGQIEGVLNFVQKNCRKGYKVDPSTGRRSPIYRWPLLAIREAISNAIVHRDYMISGHTDVVIFDDRIEIWSSGNLPEGIKIADLNKSHKSILRNPAIAEMLYFAGYIERWGAGIKSMNSLMEQSGLPAPIYNEIGSNFVVTFMDGNYQETEGLNEGLTEGLNEGLKTLYLAILNSPGIQAKDLSVILNQRPIKTVERQVKRLVELDLIERRGSRKTGGYWPVDK